MIDLDQLWSIAFNRDQLQSMVINCNQLQSIAITCEHLQSLSMYFQSAPIRTMILSITYFLFHWREGIMYFYIPITICSCLCRFDTYPHIWLKRQVQIAKVEFSELILIENNPLHCFPERTKNLMVE